MSTMLISLVVVGGAIAVVLWITVGDMAQPATQDDEDAGRPGDRHLAVVIPVEGGVAVDGHDAQVADTDEGVPADDAADDVPTLHAVDAALDDRWPDDGDGDAPAADETADDDAPAPDPSAADGAPAPADDADGDGDGDDPDPTLGSPAAPAPRTAATAGVLVADAVGPAEGTVPQAVPSRPAEHAAVGRSPGSTRSVVAIPGTYSFDPAPPVTWGRRLRSALGVVLVVTAVGLALAASLGVLAVFVSRALEGAVN